MSRETDTEHAVQHEADDDLQRAPDLEAEHDPAAARRASMAGLRREVQKRSSGGPASEGVHAAAARGVASPIAALPHADKIQASFGGHDVSQIKAHVGGNAADAMGATAFATGDHVVFDQAPDLHTAAHEAAHVVQQAHGVNLYGGVGEAGDAYERHADAVADRVVAGQSAADLLGAPSHAAAHAGGAIQMDKKKVSDATDKEQTEQHDKAGAYSYDGVAKALAMGAVHIHNAATGVDNAIGTMTEGGPTLQAQICKQWFSRVDSEVNRLRGEVAAQAGFGGTHLAPEIKRLNGAFDRFKETWERAQKHVAKYDETLSENPEWIRLNLVGLNEAGGLDFKEGSMHDRSVDERKDEVILKEAIDANSEAVVETAHSVRMGMATGKDATLEGDLKKLLRHVDEIAAQFRPGVNVKITAKSFDKGKLTKALAELAALEKEVDAKPNLAKMVQGSGLTYWLKTIKDGSGLK